MALNHVSNITPVLVPSSAGSIMTHSSGKTYVRGMIFYNSAGTTETLEVHVIPNSGGSLGTAAATNRVLRISLLSSETFTWELPFPFVFTSANDAIFAKSTTNNVVVAYILKDTE